ncbi:MAG TPA: YceI family protein [Flavobacteriales bacterium]|nr:YceI family protein [Flavobacteriales bacterium]
MKSTVLSIAALATLLVACGPSEAEKQAAREKATADSLAAAAAAEHKYTIDVATSVLNWAANVVGPAPYGHSGTISFNSGEFTVQGGVLKAGTFEVNMTSINPTDEAYQPEGSKQGTKSQLIGHLSTPDFFDNANHPTAKLSITGGSGNTATGNLTIRGNTNTETITDIVITENADGTVKATGKLVFDRQKYNVAWKHYLKDAILSDNIELTVELNGKAAQ